MNRCIQRNSVPSMSILLWRYVIKRWCLSNRRPTDSKVGHSSISRMLQVALRTIEPTTHTVNDAFRYMISSITFELCNWMKWTDGFNAILFIRWAWFFTIYHQKMIHIEPLSDWQQGGTSAQIKNVARCIVNNRTDLTHRHRCISPHDQLNDIEIV